MSSFEVTIERSSEVDKLKQAIDNGNITACSNYLTNVFSVSKDDIDDLIEMWQDSYPEIKDQIKSLKFMFPNKKKPRPQELSSFTSKTIPMGKGIKFVFLAILPIPDTVEEADCFEFCVKYEFEAYRHLRTSEAVGLLGRIFVGVGTLGISEILFATENTILSFDEEKNKKLIQKGDNGDALAAMIISKRCPKLKIKWV
ncbi:unnamed protein product [Rhizophagus irregularis]|nr:unnamed protein product [Rhizophagus irregularis]